MTAAISVARSPIAGDNPVVSKSITATMSTAFSLYALFETRWPDDPSLHPDPSKAKALAALRPAATGRVRDVDACGLLVLVGWHGAPGFSRAQERQNVVCFLK